MAETTIVQARGLYLGPSDPQTPPGAMSEATNVVISRDGIVETRRGLDVVGTKAVDRVWPYSSTLIAHGSTTLSRSSDGATWTDYSTALAPPSDAAMRAIESQRCLFLTTSDGPYRLDSTTSEPVRAGVPEALDLGLALSAGTGTAMPTDAQLGYRVLFGRKDEHGRLILGGPSSRAVIANSSGSTKDVTVSGTIPDGVTSADHFGQVYRTRESGAAATDPGDEMGLVYEFSLPTASSGTSLSRTGSTVTATTSAAHGYTAGMQVRISPGGTVASHMVAVGTSSAIQRSTDSGATWSAAGISGLPAGDYYGICSNGSLYVAVGASSLCATSADGLTWTSRTISSGSYKAVCWTGTYFVAVGDSGAASYSTDGTTWNATTASSSSYYWNSVCWTGEKVVAVGSNFGGTLAYSITSTTGTTWGTVKTIGGMAVASGVCSNGSKIVASGYDSGALGYFAYSEDGAGTWTASSSIPSTTAKGDVVWTGSVFVAVGTTNSAYSSDGDTWTNSTMPSAGVTFNGATWDGTRVVAVGADVATTTSAGVTWTDRTSVAGSYQSVAASGGATFDPGVYTITATPLSTTFEFTSAGTAGTLTAAQTITPLSFAVTDTAPDGFFGAALYTNANQEGILNANARPLFARELATFRGSLFLGHVNTPAQTIINILGTSGTNGLVANDTITLNGLAFTAKATESIINREFAVVTSGSASANIRDTAASLVRVLNRASSSPVYAQDVSDPSGVPGQVALWCRDPSVTLTIAVSRPAAWANANGVSIAPQEWKNGIAWSKTDQPDHFPKSLALAPEQVGAGDSKVLRFAATRSSLFIFKEDGLWRLTGEAGLWDIQPFDPTVRLVAPESVAVLDNSVFALCEAGVVRVSDTGVSLVSRQPGACDIQPVIETLLAPGGSGRAIVEDEAYGIAYEEDHKYVLVFRGLGGGSTTYVYDALTRTWVEWDKAPDHGCVLGGRLWFVGNTAINQVLKERKDGSSYGDRREVYGTVTVVSGSGTTSLVVSSTSNMSAGDAIEDSVIRSVDSATALTLWSGGPGAGTRTHYKGIAAATTWNPNLGASPGLLTKFKEIRLLFDEVSFYEATVEIGNTYTTSNDSITLTGTEQGTTGTPKRASVRVWPSIDASLGSGLEVTFRHRQSGMPMACSGLAITHEPVSRRTNR